MIRSLRWRIQIWHAIILLFVVVLFGSLLYAQRRHSTYQTIDNELSAAVEVLVGKLQSASPPVLQEYFDKKSIDPANSISPNFILDPASPEAQKLDADLRVPNTFAGRRIRSQDEAPYIAIWRGDGRPVLNSFDFSEVPLPELLDVRKSEWGRDRPQGTRENVFFRSRGQFRESYAPGPPGTIVLVGRDTGPDERDLFQFVSFLSAAAVCVLALGLVGGWILSGKSIQPIKEISNVAQEISSRSLDKRIDASSMDIEFADLATTLNESFSRLESAFAQQQQFTADASHELRTPLSILQMHQELALSKPRTPNEYRKSFETCLRATTRMNALAESLLMLSRLDSDPSTLELKKVDLKSVVESAADQITVLADAKQISVSLDLQSVNVMGDPNSLSQVVTNLLSNAIMHSHTGGRIDVELTSDKSKSTVLVRDYGCGIPSEDLTNIFRRFYRVDIERSSDLGGSGLGLAICKSIVAAHGGSISAESQVRSGSVFRFILPMVS